MMPPPDGKSPVEPQRIHKGQLDPGSTESSTTGVTTAGSAT